MCVAGIFIRNISRWKARRNASGKLVYGPSRNSKSSPRIRRVPERLLSFSPSHTHALPFAPSFYTHPIFPSQHFSFSVSQHVQPRTLLAAGLAAQLLNTSLTLTIRKAAFETSSVQNSRTQEEPPACLLQKELTGKSIRGSLQMTLVITTSSLRRMSTDDYILRHLLTFARRKMRSP